MAYRAPCWRVLGIAPTSDQRAIRVAYSARLKAIDPEADPQGFIALREAFEAARYEAEWVDRIDDEDDFEDEEEWDTTGGMAVPFQSDPPDALPRGADPRRTPWATDSAARTDAHANALARMLQAHTDGETYASPEEKTEMLVHWAAIIGDPRMQEIAFFADADRWFSEMIAHAIPFSDPLILPATRFFGWTRSDGMISQGWAAAKISRRDAAIEFMTMVGRPGHRFHKAWRELTKPANETSRRGKVDFQDIADLVTIVRTRHPDLEGAFDRSRVELWERPAGPDWWGLFRWGSWILLVGFFIVRLVMAAPDEGQTFKPPLLENSRADIEMALSGLFDGQLHFADIEKGNPALATALLDEWTHSKAINTTTLFFRTTTRDLLNKWLAVGLKEAGPALLTDIHRINLEIARALQAKDAAQCRNYLEGKKSNWDDIISADLHKRVMAVWVRALLTAKSDKRPESKGSVPIPAAVMNAAVARSGLTLEQMRGMLQFKGSDSHICTGRIAFMETVLTLPEKQRLPFMRAM